MTSLLPIVLLLLLVSGDALQSDKERGRKAALYAKIGLYPGYSGDMKPRGRVFVKFRERKLSDPSPVIVFVWRLKGVERACKSCGIHIHEGFGCDRDTGPHLWQPKSDPDPWLSSTYTSKYKRSKGWALLKPGDGYTKFAHIKRAVTVHDSTGARIGCGELKPFPQNEDLDSKEFNFLEEWLDAEPDYEQELAFE